MSVEIDVENQEIKISSLFSEQNGVLVLGEDIQNINDLIPKTPSTSVAEVPSDPFGLIGLGAVSTELGTFTWGVWDSPCGKPHLVASH